MATSPAPALATAPVPPQNLDAEESVLGAMMLSPLAIGAVTESTNISAADFYRESHGHIYKAILALYAKGEPVDAITVVDELDNTGTLDSVGGAERVHELAALVPAASNASRSQASSSRRNVLMSTPQVCSATSVSPRPNALRAGVSCSASNES